MFTNRRSKSDFTINLFRGVDEEIKSLYFAVAFFTKSQLLLDLADKGKIIKLVFRLGFPTKPDDIEKILEHKNIEVRFFNDNHFHTKMYLFGDRYGLVGSANLTSSALERNQELSVLLESDDDRFDDMCTLFNEYWNDAAVLTNVISKQYRKNYEAQKTLIDKVKKMNADLNLGIEDSISNNVTKNSASKASIYLKDFSHSYQESETAFNVIKEIYLSFGIRKVQETELPINIEVDLFLSFVREKFVDESYVPKGYDSNSQSRIRDHINFWHEDASEYLYNEVLDNSYPVILECFLNKSVLGAANIDKIMDGLFKLNAFRSAAKRRGYNQYRADFIENNGVDRIKSSLSYLLFGKGSNLERMCNMLHNEKYELKGFKVSSVQELFGWVHSVNHPIINGRTALSLRSYGFKIKKYS